MERKWFFLTLQFPLFLSCTKKAEGFAYHSWGRGGKIVCIQYSLKEGMWRYLVLRAIKLIPVCGHLYELFNIDEMFKKQLTVAKPPVTFHSWTGTWTLVYWVLVSQYPLCHTTSRKYIRNDSDWTCRRKQVGKTGERPLLQVNSKIVKALWDLKRQNYFSCLNEESIWIFSGISNPWVINKSSWQMLCVNLVYFKSDIVHFSKVQQNVAIRANTTKGLVTL